MFNENKLDEMGHIMKVHQDYVPVNVAKGVLTLSNGSSESYNDTTFHEILFGGDQLTVARARGTKTMRCTHDRATDRLEGLTPVVEDWHTRMTVMKVSRCDGSCVSLWVLRY